MSESNVLTKKGSVIGNILGTARTSELDAQKSLESHFVDRRTNLTETWAEQVGKGGVVSAAVMTPVLVDTKEDARNRGVAARATGIPKEPEPEVAAAAPAAPTPAMPTADSEAIAAARRRQRVAMRNRGGRASTILTEPLGG